MKRETKITKTDKSCTLFLKNIKLVAKEPSIQPFNTYIYNGPESIMHFYYTLELYRKKYSGQWEKVHTAYIYEFGIMPYIAKNIDFLLNVDARKEGIRYYFKEKNKNGETVTSKKEFEAIYPYDIAGMFNEDALHFTKHYKTFTDCRGLNVFEWYDLSILIGGNETGLAPIGCHIEHLEKTDLLVIKSFAEEFMKIAGEIAKQQIENYLTSEADSDYNDPKTVRDYLKKEYGIDDWRPIFLKLSREEYVLDEFVDYIKGKLTIDQLKCNEWHGEKRRMPELLKTMKDYEAYMYIIDDNKRY